MREIIVLFMLMTILWGTIVIDNDIENLRAEIQELSLQIEREPQVIEIETEEVFTLLRVEATAYSHGCGTGDGYTATMTRPEEGRTIAVDPEVIPLGSDVWVEGLGWMVAEDTGGAIKGNTIDIFMESEKEALAWGRRELKLVAINN